jgi:hypothetical protein
LPKNPAVYRKVGARRESSSWNRTSLYLDRDRKTSTTRVFLCPDCTYVIGHTGGDTAALRKAADYVESLPNQRIEMAGQDG